VRRLPAKVFRMVVFSPLWIFSRAHLFWFGCMVSGLYEVIQYTLFLSFLLYGRCRVRRLSAVVCLQSRM
jgi:hypothetical protein